LNGFGILKGVKIHATDAQEKQDVILNLKKISKVEVIPNFSAAIQSYLPVKKFAGIVKCVFISRISPKKNLLFFLSLVSRLSSGVKLHLTVRGNIEDQNYWQQCKNLIEKLPENITVIFDGPVANYEVISLIQQHHLFVLPTFGENFGHAIFESFTAGRPVLISDQTPWQQLEQQYAGWDIPLQNLRAFIETIEKVAQMNNNQFEQWTRGAWSYAEAHSGNSELKKLYKKLFS